MRARSSAWPAASAAWFAVACIVQPRDALSPGGQRSRPGGGVQVAAAPSLTVLDWAGHRAAASFTFDDSQPSHIQHYAELEAAGAPMTFYLSSGASAEANYDETWSRAVKDGHEIGNHTVHHCHADLGGCLFGRPLPDLGAELDECSAYISLHAGQAAAWTGASPFGDTGYEGAARTRFLAYRGVAEGMIAPNDATDPYDLPVHMAGDGEKEESFDRFTDRARAEGKWIIFLFHSILPTADRWYHPVDVADVTGSMKHARALHDVWVDTVANVAAYWRGQKVIATAAATSDGRTTTLRWTLPPHFPPGRSVRVIATAGTLAQAGATLRRGPAGHYEVSLDAGSLTLSP